MKRLAYTRKKGRKNWKRAKDLDDLCILEWLTAKLSANLHNAEVKWVFKEDSIDKQIIGSFKDGEIK